MKNKTNWLIFIVIIMLIPVILNFLLQIKTGLCVLGGSEEERSWLSFWGDFLAAIAASILGWVSLVINKKSIAQNERILHNDAWGKMVTHYNKMEDFVIAQEKLHSLETIETIKAMANRVGNGNLEDKMRVLQIKAQLRETSIKIARYVSEDPSSDKAENSLFKYGNALSDANIRMIKFIDASYESICVEQNETGQYGEKDYKDLVYSCFKIMKLGDDFLKNKKNEIIEFAKENDIEKGSFI